MRRLTTTVLLCVIAGCAAPRAPYEGLNADSYGPLTIYQDRSTHAAANPPSCDADALRYGSAVSDLSTGITQVLMRPFAGIGVHQTIKADDLEDQFRIPGDPGGPPVVVLESDARHILFWHVTELVPVVETMAAARKFCGRHGVEAVYAGTGRQCSPPQMMPIAVNGKRTMTSTYAISSYNCVSTGLQSRLSLPRR